MERANQQKTEVEKEREKVRYSKHVEECKKKRRTKGERKADSER